MLVSAKVGETTWFVGVAVICQLNCPFFIGDGMLKISQLAEVSNLNFLNNPEVGEKHWLVRMYIIH